MALGKWELFEGLTTLRWEIDQRGEDCCEHGLLHYITLLPDQKG
jgi:hypothetical protein